MTKLLFLQPVRIEFEIDVNNFFGFTGGVPVDQHADTAFKADHGA